MNTSELTTALRELCDRLDAAEVTGGNCDVDITIHGVETREALACWARVLGGDVDVNHTDHTSYLRRYPWRNAGQIGFCVHFPQGMLGGEVKQIVKDDRAGLDALLAEVPAETAGVA